MKNWAALRTTLWVAACLTGPALAAEPNDVFSVAIAPAPNAHRAYLVDMDFAHMIDGRVYVVDGDANRMIGLLSMGFSAHFTLSPDQHELYSSGTFYDRGTRGNRTDVLQIYDGLNFEYKAEVVIPSHHAQATPYPGLLATSKDGKYVFVQNATPASSVSVVDVTTKKLVGELGTAGCWSIWPAPNANNRFSTVCGDGTILSVTFDSKGKIIKTAKSDQVFDPEVDPMFVQGAVQDGKVTFVSFHGMVHTVDLNGEKAAAETPWSLVADVETDKGWRPGGMQMVAIHKATGRMFLAMHQHGAEGTHKHPADQIWVVDLKSHKLVDRIEGKSAISLSVTQDSHPLLFTQTEAGTFLRYKAEGKLVEDGQVDKLAETATEVVTP